MKVHEIINEEGMFSRFVARPLVNLAGKALKASPEKEAIMRMSEKWAEEIIATGKMVSPAERGMTADAIKVAEKNANKIASNAAYAKNLEIVKGAFGQSYEVGVKWANRVGWGVPVATTANEIRKLNEQLNNKEISREAYDQQVQYWLGKCASQILAAKAFGWALKIGGTAAGTIEMIPFVDKLGNAVVRLSPAAKAAFGVWLATPGSMGGQEAFTKWYLGETFLPSVAEFSRDWLGAWIKNGYDAISHAAYDASSGKLGSEPPAADADKKDSDWVDTVSSALPADEKDKPHQNFGGMKFDSATGKWLNRPQ